MKLKLINGNKQEYQTSTDLLLCFYKPNNFTVKRLETELGLKKVKTALDMTYFKPRNAMQIVKLLTWASTYCYKVAYSDNANQKSTLFFHYSDRENLFNK